MNQKRNDCNTRMHSSRMRTARSSSRPGGRRGGLHQAPPSVMAFWCGGLLVWSSGRGQKATKPEGHNRRPQQKAPPPEQTPESRPPPEPCCKACWDTTCNACWDSTPPETCCKACWDTTCNACWDSTPPLLTE